MAWRKPSDSAPTGEKQLAINAVWKIRPMPDMNKGNQYTVRAKINGQGSIDLAGMRDQVNEFCQLYPNSDITVTISVHDDDLKRQLQALYFGQILPSFVEWEKRAGMRITRMHLDRDLRLSYPGWLEPGAGKTAAFWADYVQHLEQLAAEQYDQPKWLNLVTR